MKCTCRPFENAAGHLCGACIEREARLIFGTTDSLDADMLAVRRNVSRDEWIEANAVAVERPYLI